MLIGHIIKFNNVDLYCPTEVYSMSHTFSIKCVKTEKKAYFDGLCNGVMYFAFNSPECNVGFSGDGSTKTITRQEALFGMMVAIDYFNRIKYPDPSRMDEIKSFFNEVLNGSLINSEKFEIEFY